jgi:serine/threonine protein kinase
MTNAGSRFGPYEIVARLGAGGMGEVYRARDTRLGREVALKTLPADVSDDPARKARFEQEARAAAALNHPNITGVHDVGSESGVSYIVTELVAGETLEAILDRGTLPVRKLLDIAVQIADGMAAAHAARITHRDLKPANVMVTTEGRVKILDFGLAKQAAIPSVSADETVTVSPTEPGMILGTVAYMSPEQARGKPADYRSDQFSFGLILYEMAAGRRAFHKPESVQTMAAILTDDAPPIDRSIPAPLRWAIDRCLAKEPGDRYESTRDLFQELRHLRDHLSEFSGMQASTATPAPGKLRSRPPWIFAGVGLLACIASFVLALYLAGPESPDQTNYRFTPFSFEPGGQYSAVWSPNGKAVAYAARTDQNSPFQIFVRYLDSASPIQITRLAEGGEPVRWAPDSQRILFGSQREPAGVWSIAAVGGEPDSFMKIDNHEAEALDVSPDLKTVAVLRSGEDGLHRIWISSPPNSPPKPYAPDPFATTIVYNSPRLKFSPDGKQILLFVHGERHQEEAWLMPYPANASRPPHRVLQDLPSYSGTPNFDWMPDSRRIVVLLRPVADAPPQIWIADTSSGKHIVVSSGTANPIAAAVSPDGGKLVVSESAGNYDVVSVDLGTAAARRLLATERDEWMPSWAARQPLLVYVTNRNGPLEIWMSSADGASRPIVTARDFPPGTTQWFMAPALSPDGGRVIYARVERDGGARLWISSVSGGAPVQLTSDPNATEFPGSFSPDGSWFCFYTVQNGKVSLVKAKVSGQASFTMVKTGVAGEVPVWSPTGEWILAGDKLISPDGQSVRPVGDRHTDTYAFSGNGKLLYGLRSVAERVVLFTVDVATGVEKIIGDAGQEFSPASGMHPAMRFSLAPDGKSIVYGAGRFKTNLWMLEGFTQKAGLLARFGLR